MKNYYVILRNIIGKLCRVDGYDTKAQATKEVNHYVSLGYQATLVAGSILRIAENLTEERAFLGFEEII